MRNNSTQNKHRMDMLKMPVSFSSYINFKDISVLTYNNKLLIECEREHNKNNSSATTL
jgi:hypothetical protein